MEKIIFVFFFCIFALSCTNMQESKDEVVAVFVTGDEDASVNKVFGSKFVSAIVEEGKYKAVERTENFLEELGREQSFQRTGKVSDSRISEIGKLYGADMVCVIDITEVHLNNSTSHEKYIASKLIDSETSEVYKVRDVNEKWESLDELSEVAGDLAIDLLSANDSLKIAVENRRKERLEKKIRVELHSEPVHVQINYEDYEVLPTDLDGSFTYAEAKKVCEDLVAFGKDDWFLPDKTVLAGIYNRKDEIGGFSGYSYWSSSESASYTAWDQRFSDGSQSSYFKDYGRRVRCVRKY